MRTRSRRGAVPTWTSLALEWLEARDDFAGTREVAAAVGASYNQACAALIHLRSRHAVDCVVDKGAAWWFATPRNDDRSQVHDERRPENGPRKPRRKKRGAGT